MTEPLTEPQLRAWQKLQRAMREPPVPWSGCSWLIVFCGPGHHCPSCERLFPVVRMEKAA